MLACLYLAGAFNFAKRWVQGWARRPQLEVRCFAIGGLPSPDSVALSPFGTISNSIPGSLRAPASPRARCPDGPCGPQVHLVRLREQQDAVQLGEELPPDLGALGAGDGQPAPDADPPPCRGRGPVESQASEL